MESLFEKSSDYDGMLQSGLKLSGENKFYFIEGRINELKKTLEIPGSLRILDFGCGVGDTSQFLLEAFPGSYVKGIDTSKQAIDFANNRFGSVNISFCTLEEFEESNNYDLCYVNGVFHHIPIKERKNALSIIHNALTSSGILAFFENNPLNIGTRIIMSRIPFDRDAVLINHWKGKKMLRENNFSILSTKFLFYFPRVLSFLRSWERYLVRIPFGAQYCILVRKN